MREHSFAEICELSQTFETAPPIPEVTIAKCHVTVVDEEMEEHEARQRRVHRIATLGIEDLIDEFRPTLVVRYPPVVRVVSDTEPTEWTGSESGETSEPEDEDEQRIAERFDDCDEQELMLRSRERLELEALRGFQKMFDEPEKDDVLRHFFPACEENWDLEVQEGYEVEYLTLRSAGA